MMCELSIEHDEKGDFTRLKKSPSEYLQPFYMCSALVLLSFIRSSRPDGLLFAKDYRNQSVLFTFFPVP